MCDSHLYAALFEYTADSAGYVDMHDGVNFSFECRTVLIMFEAATKF